MSDIHRSTVVKFQLYPKNKNPEGYAVGFSVEVTNGETFYIDTLVSMGDAEHLSNSRIVELAWMLVKESAESRAQITAMDSVVGRVVESQEPLPDHEWWNAELAAEGHYDTADVVSHRDELWVSLKDDNKAEPGVKDWQRYSPLPPPPDEDDSAYPEWTVGNTYATGDVVSHNGQLWTSIKDDNKSEPGIKDWTLVESSTPDEGATPEEEATPTEPATPDEEATPSEPATPDEEATPTEDATPTEPATPDEEATPSETYPAWDSNLTYAINDIVSHNGENWISLKNGNTDEPGVKGWNVYAG